MEQQQPIRISKMFPLGNPLKQNFTCLFAAVLLKRLWHKYPRLPHNKLRLNYFIGGPFHSSVSFTNIIIIAPVFLGDDCLHFLFLCPTKEGRGLTKSFLKVWVFHCLRGCLLLSPKCCIRAESVTAPSFL